MDTTLNKIEKNFRLYADSYLAIDSIVYRKKGQRVSNYIKERASILSN
jgi:hypothetical protein